MESQHVSGQVPGSVHRLQQVAELYELVRPQVQQLTRQLLYHSVLRLTSINLLTAVARFCAVSGLYFAVKSSIASMRSPPNQGQLLQHIRDLHLAACSARSLSLVSSGRCLYRPSCRAPCSALTT